MRPAPINVAAALRCMRRLMARPIALSVAPSPDGRWLAVVTEQPDWKNNAVVYRLTIRPTHSPRAVASVDLPARPALAWEPDSGALLGMASRKPGGPTGIFRGAAGRFLLRWLNLKVASRVTHMVLGPDGGLYYATPDRPTVNSPWTVAHPRRLEYCLLKRHPAGRSIARIEATAMALTIDSTGRWLAYAARRTPEPESLYRHELRLLDLRSGKVRTIGRRDWGVADCRFSPDSPLLAFTAKHWAGQYPTPNELWTYNLATGCMKNLTAKLDRSVMAIAGWERPSEKFPGPGMGAILATVSEGVSLNLKRFDLAGGCENVVAGNVLGAGIDRAGRIHVVTADENRVPGAHLLGKTPTATHGAMPTSEAIKWRGPGGRQIEGLLILPRGKRKNLPTLLYVHGGPNSMVNHFLGRIDLCWSLAAAGCAVLVPCFRGTNGYGRDFSRALPGDMIRAPFADSSAGLDFLILRGIADPQRLAIAGLSYGGFTTLWALANTPRFRAGVCQAGVFDLVSDAGHTQRGVWARTYLGKHYWDAPELYRRSAAIGNIRKLRAPVLLLHGQDDSNTHVVNAHEAAYALRNLGRTFRLKIYAGEEHGLVKPLCRLDAVRETAAWLAKYV